MLFSHGLACIETVICSNTDRMKWYFFIHAMAFDKLYHRFLPLCVIQSEISPRICSNHARKDEWIQSAKTEICSCQYEISSDTSGGEKRKYQNFRTLRVNCSIYGLILCNQLAGSDVHGRGRKKSSKLIKQLFFGVGTLYSDRTSWIIIPRPCI